MTDAHACEECARAAAGPWHAFLAHCQGCRARMVARGPQFAAAAAAGRQTRDYREALAGAGVTHAQVQAAAAADALSPKPA